MLRGYSQTVIDLRAIQMGHEHGVWGGDINEKYVVSGSGDRSVMVWDSQTVIDKQPMF